MDDYYKKRDLDNFEKINSLLVNLPEFVSLFIIGISNKTSTLTRLNYLNDIKIFFDYLSKTTLLKNVKDISASDLENLKAYNIEMYLDYLTSYNLDGKTLSCSERAKERKLSSIRSLYKYLFQKDMISKNVSLKVDMPKIHDKPIIRLSNNEIPEILDRAADGQNLSGHAAAYHENTKYRDEAIIYLFLGTGIRVSELVGLNRTDFDFNNGSFIVTRKGGNRSILYLPQEVIDILQDYIAWVDMQIENKTKFGQKIIDKNVMFHSLQGNRIGVRAVEKMVKKYASIVTPLKKITPHKLRSTFATQLYQETKNIYVVADVLGHSDVNTTKKHYAQMSEEIKKQAADITKLKKSN
ncbi:MAG: tyrosine-type recombinase/integrase [Clostridia bacterium]|nr:tyrosine-type recombinase/integrase [Clostridia bacterium]